LSTALRPLSTGELLDRTFSLYRTHFVLFVGIFALPHLCVLAFQLLALGFPTPLFQVFAGVGVLLLTVLVSAASQAATVVAVSQVHLDRAAGIFESYSKVKNQILGVIGLSMYVGFLVGLATLALIVPGIWLTICWSLAVPAKVLENLGVSQATARSSQLTQGNRGRVFVMWLLFIVLSIGVAMLLQWPIQLAAGVSGAVNAKRGLQHVDVLWQVASVVASFVSQSLVGPLATIAFSLVYYDERVRKEAFDLQLMMATIDAPELQVSPAH
jgi:hypothetical protein